MTSLRERMAQGRSQEAKGGQGREDDRPYQGQGQRDSLAPGGASGEERALVEGVDFFDGRAAQRQAVTSDDAWDIQARAVPKPAMAGLSCWIEQVRHGEHSHAPDTNDSFICHTKECGCVRCLLERGDEVPRDLRGRASGYMMRTEVEMFKCPRCSGLRLGVLEPTKYTQMMWWCMKCGNQGLVQDEPKTNEPKSLRERATGVRVAPAKPQTLLERMGKRPAAPQPKDDDNPWQVGRYSDPEPQQTSSLRDRFKSESKPHTQGKTKASSQGTKVVWTDTERDELSTLIRRYGISKGIFHFLGKHPSRTSQGCQFQWYKISSKGG